VGVLSAALDEEDHLKIELTDGTQYVSEQSLKGEKGDPGEGEPGPPGPPGPAGVSVVLPAVVGFDFGQNGIRGMRGIRGPSGRDGRLFVVNQSAGFDVGPAIPVRGKAGRDGASKGFLFLNQNYQSVFVKQTQEKRYFPSYILPQMHHVYQKHITDYRPSFRILQEHNTVLQKHVTVKNIHPTIVNTQQNFAYTKNQFTRAISNNIFQNHQTQVQRHVEIRNLRPNFLSAHSDFTFQKQVSSYQTKTSLTNFEHFTVLNYARLERAVAELRNIVNSSSLLRFSGSSQMTLIGASHIVLN
jgi:hypothetical protein